jgi:soluble lytic murein transglycosylase-like protein
MTVRGLFAATALAVVLGAAMAPPVRAYLDAKAAYGMALTHHHPIGGEVRNYTHAMILYCRADSDDYAPAAYAIGLLYAGGHGVKRDDARAAAWFRRAASLGHVEAKEMLAIYARPGKRRSAICPNGWGRGATVRQALRAPGEIKALVEKLAPRFGLDPKLVLAVVSVESAFQPEAVSSANARGLMQLIPATAERFGVRDVFDPAQNLRGGMAYLEWLLQCFKDNVALALAGYNAGEGAVKKYGGIPPYKETQRYVQKIRRLYAKREHPY